jgi:hypothetical protein
MGRGAAAIRTVKDDFGDDGSWVIFAQPAQNKGVRAGRWNGVVRGEVDDLRAFSR